MNENYIVINGKRLELTKEQLKALGIEVGKNPFERVAKSEMYCYIDSFNQVHCVADDADNSDEMSFECSNYFNDETFAEQVALHHLLYRKLLRFAYDNGLEDTSWEDCNNSHYKIFYRFDAKTFGVNCNDVLKQQGAVYFSSKEATKRAINEVVKPFMEEHPDFVW